MWSSSLLGTPNTEKGKSTFSIVCFFPPPPKKNTQESKRAESSVFGLFSVLWGVS